MNRKIFEQGFPNLDFIFKNWPRSKYILKKYIVSRQKKPNLLWLSTICLKELNAFGNHRLFFALKKISNVCSSNLYNTFHNEHHFKTVLIISFLFAKFNSLKNIDKITLIIVALAHDMNHLGRRLNNEEYYQEKKTVKDLERIVFRTILNHKLWKRIERIILNTYFPKDFKTHKKDIVERIILKSDIICSILFNDETGKIFTERLKFELRLNESTEKLFLSFKKKIKKRFEIKDDLNLL